MAITVVGSVALDTVETPFGKIEKGLGGSGSHFSASASFYSPINLVGVVGSDFDQAHLDFFKSRKINLDGLEIVEGGKSFHWVGKYDFDLNTAHTLETHLNVFETFSPKLPESYRNSDVLFLANIHPALQNHVIDEAGKPGLIALDTMNLWIDTTKEELLKVIKRVDLVTINEAEARSLTGNPNLVQASRAIQELGPKTVVIKRGEYGALMFHEDKIFNAPALPLESIFDPTGAGDSFAGGMLGYIAKRNDYTFDTLKTAVICGSVMASFNVEKFSCDRLKELTKEEISARFAEFQSLGSFEGIQF